jgi:hypothetical protein
MDIGYFYCCIFPQFLVHCVKKNLATLLHKVLIHTVQEGESTLFEIPIQKLSATAKEYKIKLRILKYLRPKKKKVSRPQADL